jgi:basic amino acid/polyamine antiporter, APA family
LNVAAANTPLAEGSRTLGFWMCSALVVGNIIGIGIFAMPAALAPYGLNALTGWLVTVIGCALLAVSFAALSRAFPHDDGPQAYTARAFGPGPAFIVMWSYCVSLWVGDAAIAIGVAGYLTVFLPALAHTPGLPAIAALSMIWVFTFVNLLGARAAGWVQILTTLLKLVPQFAVILLGLSLLFTQPAVYGAHVPRNPPSWHEVSSVSTLALFAMLGIECAMVPAGRVRDPARTIPRATLVGTLLAAFIYIAVSAVPMLLIPQRELATSDAPYADLFTRTLGGHYGEIVAAFVIVSGLGVLNGWTLIVGEVTQCMARHGGLPSALSRENRHRAPARALIVAGIVTSLMLLTNYTESVTKVFALLIVIATAGSLPLYFASALALLELRRRGQLPRTAAPAAGPGPWTLAVAAGAAAYCIWVSVGIGTEALLWALALCGAGVPLYLWSCLRRRPAPLGSEATSGLPPA